MDVNLNELFGLSTPFLEIVIRGTSIYWFLFIVFRLVLRRDVGSIGIADVLVLVVIADASQNAMSGQYESITDGFILVGTIVFWNVLFDWLAFRYPRIEKLIQPRVLCLVRDGQVLHRNMRREFISMDDLMGQLREKGIDRLSDVRRAYMESDGRISVVQYGSAKQADQPARPFA